MVRLPIVATFLLAGLFAASPAPARPAAGSPSPAALQTLDAAGAAAFGDLYDQQLWAMAPGLVPRFEIETTAPTRAVPAGDHYLVTLPELRLKPITPGDGPPPVVLVSPGIEVRAFPVDGGLWQIENRASDRLLLEDGSGTSLGAGTWQLDGPQTWIWDPNAALLRRVTSVETDVVHDFDAILPNGRTRRTVFSREAEPGADGWRLSEAIEWQDRDVLLSPGLGVAMDLYRTEFVLEGLDWAAVTPAVRAMVGGTGDFLARARAILASPLDRLVIRHRAEGFVVELYDTGETFRLPGFAGTLAIGRSEADARHVDIRMNAAQRGLRYTHQGRPTPVVPGEAQVTATIEGLDADLLWRAYVDSWDPGFQAPGKLRRPALAALATAARVRGAGLTIDRLALIGPDFEFRMRGAIQLDATAPGGFTGRLQARVLGLDGLVTDLSLTPTPGVLSQPLGWARDLGLPLEDATGRLIGREYEIVATGDGPPMLNGADMTPLVNVLVGVLAQQ